MKVINIIDVDQVNYKNFCMTIMMPYCSFKCDKEYGKQVCQNGTLANSKTVDISVQKLISRYKNNNLSTAICFQGLEPLDSWEDLFSFITTLRCYNNINDDVVIYTGYNKEEIQDKINILKKFDNIIIKYGRYIPDQQPHHDKILGVDLASDNQYAEKLN